MVEQSVHASTPATAASGAVSRDLSMLPPSAPPTNHGHTTAAWTLVIIVLLGATIAAVAMIAGVAWLVWAGFGVILMGIVVGKVLQILGHGQGGAATLAKQANSSH